jgi:hypothetical protein
VEHTQCCKSLAQGVVLLYRAHSSDLEGATLILPLIEGPERQRSAEISQNRRFKLQQMPVGYWFTKGIALLYLEAA